MEHIFVFFQEIQDFSSFFRFVLVCFEIFIFGCFASIPKQGVLMFRLNQNKQKTKRNSLIESIFWYFYENLVCFGLFRNSYVCFYCFDMGSKHPNRPKQNETFCVWFHETNQNKTETDLVLVCFGSNRNFLCLFQGTGLNLMLLVVCILFF
jgi:hypothetical protein